MGKEIRDGERDDQGSRRIGRAKKGRRKEEKKKMGNGGRGRTNGNSENEGRERGTEGEECSSENMSTLCQMSERKPLPISGFITPYIT